MANARYNDLFAAELLPAYPLDAAIEWIKANMKPEDVFDVAQLEEWAEENDWAPTEDAA